MSTEELATLYCNGLEEVKTRLALIRSVLGGSLTAGSELFNYEIVAMHLRKTLEVVAFGSMTANREAYSAAHADFAKHWNAKRLLDKLFQLHPEFYPKPIYVAQDDPGPPRHLHFDFLTDGFLTQAEFVELYDLCSQVIHTRNPFAPSDIIDFRYNVAQWCERIERLLSMHLMRLAGTPQVWIARLNDPSDNKAHAAIAIPRSDSGVP